MGFVSWIWNAVGVVQLSMVVVTWAFQLDVETSTVRG